MTRGVTVSGLSTLGSRLLEQPDLRKQSASTGGEHACRFGLAIALGRILSRIASEAGGRNRNSVDERLLIGRRYFDFLELRREDTAFAIARVVTWLVRTL